MRIVALAVPGLADTRSASAATFAEQRPGRPGLPQHCARPHGGSDITMPACPPPLDAPFVLDCAAVLDALADALRPDLDVRAVPAPPPDPPAAATTESALAGTAAVRPESAGRHLGPACRFDTVDCAGSPG